MYIIVRISYTSFLTNEIEDYIDFINANVINITEEEAGKVLRFISYFNGEVSGIVVRMLDMYTNETAYQDAKVLYEKGRPMFLDYKIEEDIYKLRLDWKEDDFEFFNDLRNDAKTVWDEMCDSYRTYSKRLKNVNAENSKTV